MRFVTHPHAGFHAARCRNDGVRNSTAPHLLFIDGDCLLPPDHVEQHLRFWRPGAVTCSYCVRFGPACRSSATLEAVRARRVRRLGAGTELRKLRHMHFKSIWYGLIGHPTKPAFRSGEFSRSPAKTWAGQRLRRELSRLGLRGRRLRPAVARRRHSHRSILNRTCVYHLWHPPAPTRPRAVEAGRQRGLPAATDSPDAVPERARASGAARLDACACCRTADRTRDCERLVAGHGWNWRTIRANEPTWSCCSAPAAADSAATPTAACWRVRRVAGRSVRSRAGAHRAVAERAIAASPIRCACGWTTWPVFGPPCRASDYSTQRRRPERLAHPLCPDRRLRAAGPAAADAPLAGRVRQAGGLRAA